MWKVLTNVENYRIIESDGRYELVPAEMPAIEMPAFFKLTYSQDEKSWWIDGDIMTDKKVQNQNLCGGPEAFCLFKAEGKVWLQPGWSWWRKGEFRGCLPEISLEEEFCPLIDYAKEEIRLLRKSEVVKL